MYDTILIINAILVGVIIVTQLVSYPLFLEVEEIRFTNYHKKYTSRISIIVLPIMLAEIFITIYMIIVDASNQNILAGLILFIIWISTFILQVPIHNKISIKKDIELIHLLIRTNWIRTFLWIIKLFILI